MVGQSGAAQANEAAQKAVQGFLREGHAELDKPVVDYLTKVIWEEALASEKGGSSLAGALRLFVPSRDGLEGRVEALLKEVRQAAIEDEHIVATSDRGIYLSTAPTTESKQEDDDPNQSLSSPASVITAARSPQAVAYLTSSASLPSQRDFFNTQQQQRDATDLARHQSFPTMLSPASINLVNPFGGGGGDHGTSPGSTPPGPGSPSVRSNGFGRQIYGSPSSLSSTRSISSFQSINGTGMGGGLDKTSPPLISSAVPSEPVTELGGAAGSAVSPLAGGSTAGQQGGGGGGEMGTVSSSSVHDNTSSHVWANTRLLGLNPHAREFVPTVAMPGSDGADGEDELAAALGGMNIVEDDRQWSDQLPDELLPTIDDLTGELLQPGDIFHFESPPLPGPHPQSPSPQPHGPPHSLQAMHNGPPGSVGGMQAAWPPPPLSGIPSAPQPVPRGHGGPMGLQVSNSGFNYGPRRQRSPPQDGGFSPPSAVSLGSGFRYRGPAPAHRGGAPDNGLSGLPGTGFLRPSYGPDMMQGRGMGEEGVGRDRRMAPWMIDGHGHGGYENGMQQPVASDPRKSDMFAAEEGPPAAEAVSILSANFPGFNPESLAEVYLANGRDLNLTMDMLTQLEMTERNVTPPQYRPVASPPPPPAPFSPLEFPTLGGGGDMGNGHPSHPRGPLDGHGLGPLDSPLVQRQQGPPAMGRRMGGDGDERLIGMGGRPGGHEAHNRGPDFAAAVRKGQGPWGYERNNMDMGHGLGQGQGPGPVRVRDSNMESRGRGPPPHGYGGGFHGEPRGPILRGDRGEHFHGGQRDMHRGGPSPVPWVETGEAVGQMYTEFREEARDHARVRNQYFDQAAQAYMAGNKALAKELSAKGQWHNDQMKAAHVKSAEAIFRHSRNPLLPGVGPGERQGGGGGQGNSQRRMLDLHGLHVNEALMMLKRELQAMRAVAQTTRQRQQTFVCVGTGHHTKGSRMPARLSAAVERFLHEEDNVQFSEVQPGLVRVVV